MGFYDEIDEKSYRPKRKQNRFGFTWFLSVIIAAVVGSSTTIVLLPLVDKSPLIEQATPAMNNQVSNVDATKTATLKINTDVTDAVNKVRPAVVTVVNIQNAQSLFGDAGMQDAGKGSGVIIDKEGHIVTNNHVVEGAASIEVIINSQRVKAQVLGTDEFTDLAVLKVDASAVKGIEPVQYGSSDSLQIGEPAIAIGNPLGEFDQTVTVGVISAKQRTLPLKDQMGNVIYEQSVLQTDAAINPGNSGGALINIEGNLIGINSAKIASSGVEGLGFAIPIDEVKPIVEQLKDHGKVSRPALGVTIGYEVKDIPKQYNISLPIDYGVVIEDATGAAKQAGLQRGDILAQIDDTKINSFIDLRKYLFTKKEGDTVHVTFYRKDEKKTATITLQKLAD